MAPGRKPSALIDRIVSLISEELESLDRDASLPPEVELARSFGVARKSVRAAMGILEKRGLVRRIRGKGTFPARGKQARAIFRSRARKIAVAGVGLHSAFYNTMLDGAFREIQSRQGELVLSVAQPVGEGLESCFRLFDDRSVDGVILVAFTDQDLIAELAARGKPVCLVDHFSEKARIDCVRADSYGAARLGMDHLHNLGHERIAYVQPEDPMVNPRRLEGYRDALDAVGIAAREAWLVSAPTTADGGAQAAMRLLALSEGERPTAIMTFSDEMALGAMHATIRFGLRVPEDLSVIGAGGIAQILSVGMPELTCVKLDAPEMGRTAARYLWERIDNPGMEVHDTVIPTSLILGQSTSRCSKT